jgi:ABC-type phosphate transport system substrate-binding protein
MGAPDREPAAAKRVPLAALALRFFTGAAIVCRLLPGPAAAADRYKVVINAANPVTSVARREASAMFLRRSTRWADGTPVMAVDGPDSPTRDAFSKDVHGKKARAVRSYWLQIIFSGRGVPPPEKATDDDVITHVKAHPGAIGYVAAAAATDDVRVLKVTP